MGDIVSSTDGVGDMEPGEGRGRTWTSVLRKHNGVFLSASAELHVGTQDAEKQCSLKNATLPPLPVRA